MPLPQLEEYTQSQIREHEEWIEHHKAKIRFHEEAIKHHKNPLGDLFSKI